MLAFYAKAQDPNQVIAIGDSYWQKQDYFGARFYYDKALQLDSGSVEVLFKYARSLFQTGNYEPAARYFLKTSLLDQNNSYPEADYYLAESYKMSGDYRKARRYYNRALQPYRRDRNSYWYKRIDQQKDALKWAMRQDQGDPVEISKIGSAFSDEATEWSPFSRENNLYFSALVADSTGKGNVIKDKIYLSKLYRKNGDLAESIAVYNAKNQPITDKHLANLMLLEEGRAFFSVCDTNFKCEIWEAKMANQRLINAQPLNNNINHPSANNTQPFAFLYDGNEYILFASNREGGFGGYDIYLARREKFGFDQPKNLGATINTPGDEITPFYHAMAGTLFFSSDWHYGFGGFDIFSSRGDKLRFNTAENMGQPINTPQDDYYFKTAEETAYLASNRFEEKEVANCCNDIFELPFSLDNRTDTIKNNETDTQKVSIAVLNRYLPLELYFHNDMPDPGSRDSITNKNYKKLAESYLAMEEEYIKFLSEKKDYAPQEKTLTEESKAFFEEEVAAGLDDLEYFTPYLLQALQEGERVTLNIKGFASTLAANDYNLLLTSRRINSLVNYFRTYKNGVLLPFINNKTEAGGQLRFNRIPYGEFAAIEQFDEKNRVMAVYSPAAAIQRKIEVIAVTETPEGKKQFDSREKVEQAALSLNSESYTVELQESVKIIDRFFNLKNTGGGELEIYNVVSNCACATVKYPAVIPAGEEDKIMVKIDSKDITTETKIELTLVTNATPNLYTLSITLKP
jgi:hypothetical protein